VVDERAQRVEAEALLERRLGVLLLGVRGDQGGVDVNDQRMTGVGVVVWAARTLSTSAASRVIVRDRVGSEATEPKTAGSARTTARSEQVSPPRANVNARSSRTLAGSWVAPTGRHGTNAADSPASRPAALTVEVSSTPPA
jgi:hypothetical protein